LITAALVLNDIIHSAEEQTLVSGELKSLPHV